MSAARVTVLMPAWNAGELIRPAIESVLAQTISDWELLVVDDCSSDGTHHVIAEYAASDSRIRLVRLDPNRGQTAALNHGLGLIETPWTARLDHDDICAPDRLERQLAYAESHPRTALVGSWIDFIGPEGDKIGAFHPASEAAEVRRELYARSLPIAHSSALINTAAVRGAGGYGTRFTIAQDYELWVRLALCGEIANVPARLVQIRIHPGQASGSYEANARQIREQIAVMDTLPALFALDDAELKLWGARRLRLTSQLAWTALRHGDRAVATEQARASLAAVRRQPQIAVPFARSAAKRGFRLSVDAAQRSGLKVADRYGAPS